MSAPASSLPSGGGAMAALRRRWAALQAREQRLLVLAAVLVALAVLWLGLLQPPWKALQRARAQQAVLAAQEAQMLQWKAQAQALQQRPQPSRQDTVLALQSSIKRLGGEVTLQVQGDMARLTLARVQASALASWLAAGSGTDAAALRLVPAEAQLRRSGSATAPTWDGSLSYPLPPPDAAAKASP